MGGGVHMQCQQLFLVVVVVAVVVAAVCNQIKLDAYSNGIEIDFDLVDYFFLTFFQSVCLFCSSPLIFPSTRKCSAAALSASVSNDRHADRVDVE